ncbi:MAG: AsmA family protein [Deltaproteobacteria bacterium]|jgi:uncharacterized protein involved in outer membrane biogenesis|nr:AsmA family protein [Deltaproteobacteria bacterium]
MKKLLKKVILILGGLILVFFLALGIALLVIDPNDYREEISRLVKQATGRQLELKGRLSLKIFPRLALNAREVSLAPAQGFEPEPPLAVLDEISLRMAILPLFSGEVQVDAVLLNGLNLNLVTNVQGRNNWDDSESATNAPLPAENEASSLPPPEEDAQKRLNTLLQSRITEVLLENCAVRYQHQGQNQDYFLRLNQLRLDEVGLNRDISFALDMEAEDGKAGIKAGLILGGILKYMFTEKDIIFNLKNLKIDAETPQLQGRQEINGNAGGRFNLASLAGRLDCLLRHSQGELEMGLDFGLGQKLLAEGDLGLKGNPLGLLPVLKIEIPRNSPLASSPDSPLSSLDASLHFRLQDKLLSLSKADFRLGGEKLRARVPTLTALLEENTSSQYPLKKLELNFELALVPEAFLSPAGIKVPSGLLRSLEAYSSVSMQGREFTFSGLSLNLDQQNMLLEAPSIKLTPAVSPKADLPLAQAEGSLQIKGNPWPYMALAGVNPHRQDAGSLNNLESSLNFSLKENNLRLSGFNFKIDSDLIVLSIPSLSARLDPASKNSPPFSSLETRLSLSAKPRLVLNALGLTPKTSDPETLGAFSAGFGLSLKNNELTLSALEASLDQTSIKGSATSKLPGAAGLPAETLASFRGGLQLGVLDIDRYLPPPEAKESSPFPTPVASRGARTEKPGQTAQGPFQGSVLGHVQAELALDMRRLTIKKIPLENIVLQALLDKGELTLKKAQGKIFGGSVSASGKAGLVSPLPPVSLTAKTRGLDLGKALLTLLDEKRLSGNVDLNLDLAFKGLENESILSSLDGKGDILVKEGKISGLDLIPQGAPAEIARYRQSGAYVFNDFGGSFTARQGKLINDHLTLKSRDISVTGSGSIALLSREVEYKGMLTTKGIDNLPLIIRGPIHNLSVSIDLEALANITATKAAEKALQDLRKKSGLPVLQESRDGLNKQIQKGGEKLEQELQRGLNKIFGK